MDRERGHVSTPTLSDTDHCCAPDRFARKSHVVTRSIAVPERSSVHRCVTIPPQSSSVSHFLTPSLGPFAQYSRSTALPRMCRPNAGISRRSPWRHQLPTRHDCVGMSRVSECWLVGATAQTVAFCQCFGGSRSSARAGATPKGRETALKSV